MYFNKIVTNLLDDINYFSIDILDEQISNIIEIIIYLIDTMRVKISFFTNVIVIMSQFYILDFVDIMDNLNRKNSENLTLKEFKEDAERRKCDA